MDALLRMDRRRLLRLLAAGVVTTGAAACDESPAVGRRQLILVSDEQLAELTRQAWTDLKAKTPVSRDPALNRTLARVGRAVADASGRPDLSWEFVVFDTPEVNAFVLPGGKVGFHRGLMKLSGSDDELAAVMGHEVSHVLARHAAERVSQQLAVETGAGLAGALIGGENAEQLTADLGASLLYGVILPYSRRHELEADRLGVGLAARAGYDPAGAVRFTRKMIAAGGGGAPIPFLSTHPPGPERLAALEAEAARLARTEAVPRP